MGSEVLPTPSDVMAKATRMLKRVMLLQTAWSCAFSLVACSWCGRRGRTASARHLHEWGQGHRDVGRELRAPLVPLAGAPGPGRDRWAFGDRVRGDASRVRYLGAGAAASYGTAAVSPDDGPRAGGQDMGGGFPGSAMPPGFGAGLPPAARGRRRDRSPDNIRTRLSSFGPAKVGNAPRVALAAISYIFCSRPRASLGVRRTPVHRRCRQYPEHC